eukprot:GEMP01042782.1.p1 GENE.GEMP01042782.1~~GEMP01042782.1.p1  ORF type:complete len:227 (+),score=44.47 GEMP01042782.1:221-901(+)
MLDLDHVHLPWDIPHVEHGDHAVTDVDHATNFYAWWGSSNNFRTRNLTHDTDSRHSTFGRILTSFGTAPDKALTDEVRLASKQALATAKTDLEGAGRISEADPQDNVDSLEGGQKVHVISASPKKHDHPVQDAKPADPDANEFAVLEPLERKIFRCVRSVLHPEGKAPDNTTTTKNVVPHEQVPFVANEGESSKEASRRIALTLLHREDKSVPESFERDNLNSNQK